VESTKRCGRCGEDRPLEQFTRNRRTRDGRGNWCKPCFSAYNRGRYRQSREQVREQHLRRWFGLTMAEYQAMLKAQGGVCAICGGEEPREGASLAVDHDPISGAVRALLCSRCNIALGQMHDDPERLRLAADYLEGFGPVKTPYPE
jgi:hypothetical protein